MDSKSETNMDFTDVFVNLYKKVLLKEKNIYSVSDFEIRNAIQAMKEVYKPDPLWEDHEVLSVANYKDPAYHCAYLHKYAMLYTGMVCDIFQMAIKSNWEIHTYINSKRRLSLCSLGGGPGTDVIGALAAVYACCQYIPCTVVILDYYDEWRQSFDLLIQELQSGNSGGLKSMVSSQFHYGYLEANLLIDVERNAKVREIVKAADFLTMVKFISAAACQATRKMVKNIFNYMKPGAMLLFIDNAAGGFQQMMQQVAYECGMVTVFGPLAHYDYENVQYSINQFNYTSQSKTKVCVQIWKKIQVNSFDATQDLRNDYYVRVRAQAAVDVTSRINRQQEESGCCSII